MMVLVVGGSGSGKSSYAEQTAVSLAQTGMRKYYLATMRVFDDEGGKKVARHRESRCGKGFFTIEQPARIADAVEKMKDGVRTVLLECISNLTANEMFMDEKAMTEMQAAENIIRDIELLKEQTTHFVVVSNNVFEDGMIYDEATTAYIRAMGKINQKLAALADRVVEVTAGIPVIIQQYRRAEKDMESVKKMKLIIGGTAQGKLEYVLARQDVQRTIVWDGVLPDEAERKEKLVIIHHFHQWVRSRMISGGCPEDEIMSFLDCNEDCIIICDEIGNGIVPADPFERAYRERVGKILVRLAERAEEVERVICGIGQRIK